MTTSRVLTWQVTESGGYETAWIELEAGALRARGRVVGTRPEPYWITYELRTGDGFGTGSLMVSAETADGTRGLDLLRDPGGHWTADGEPLPGLDGALDCDLGLSPLTNTMPVLRHGLHERAGSQEFLMAWVRVPDLAVLPSRQTYTHLAPGLVRFTSGSYRSDLSFDADGLVTAYPGMARRLERGTGEAAPDDQGPSAG
ncbi:putative glycolipid-binding domain-containing protein [Actinacidiphila acididurans]|uniref:Glycolipid-binding domain-containing protein n=1 Tax=Actinacidiphila acididurans TaxID=2784346 RepID=A0ABS2TR83_9ACTN|nr:putative glycolipid-binding domain-containing protein [Actinacidiphila acididurans]MBM9505854.1 putative glycolipid-binding domain-containing protein [Actinacidiphila acididurans]